MEFYEITTGNSQKDIDDAINDIKKITTDLFTQSFMYSATETLLQIYYASHIIGANNIIKQITNKNNTFSTLNFLLNIRNAICKFPKLL